MPQADAHHTIGYCRFVLLRRLLKVSAVGAMLELST